MRLVFKVIFVVLAVFVTAAYAASFSEFNGQINASGINVRVDATTGSAVICTLTKEDQVEVIAQAYDWYKIRLPKIAPSYIKKELVECIDLDFASKPQGNGLASDSQSHKPQGNGFASDSQSHKPARSQNHCKNGKVIKDRVNIRLGASESSWILGKIDKLTVVNILADEGAWLRIEPVHMSFGWVNKKFIDKATKELVSFKKEIKLEVVLKEDELSDALTIEGVVCPYGIVLWRKATHKLITTDKQIYFLKGDRKGLDSLNYHKVKITGKLITPLSSKYPIVDVAVIEALN